MFVTKVIHEATVATDKNMSELVDCMKQIESGSCLSLFLLKIFFFKIRFKKLKFGKGKMNYNYSSFFLLHFRCCYNCLRLTFFVCQSCKAPPQIQ